MGTKINPSSFNCYANAKQDEPMFVLLGRDVLGAWLVRIWCYMRVGLGKNTWNDPQIVEARACADQMEQYCRTLGREPVATRTGLETLLEDRKP